MRIMMSENDGIVRLRTTKSGLSRRIRTCRFGSLTKEKFSAAQPVGNIGPPELTAA
jgi:hypothetical protein